jgi:hypothetical protein
MKGARQQVTTIHKDMGITHSDFYRELSQLLEGIPCQQQAGTTTFRFFGKTVQIVVGPELVRELGPSVKLPSTRVTLHLFNFAETEVTDFVRLFNLRFMKGGG